MIIKLTTGHEFDMASYGGDPEYTCIHAMLGIPAEFRKRNKGVLDIRHTYRLPEEVKTRMYAEIAKATYSMLSDKAKRRVRDAVRDELYPIIVESAWRDGDNPRGQLAALGIIA